MRQLRVDQRLQLTATASNVDPGHEASAVAVRSGGGRRRRSGPPRRQEESGGRTHGPDRRDEATLLKRYLGNKTGLLSPILQTIGRHAAPGERVGDLFAGTLAVPLALKAAGYDVVANDVNAFSTTTGRAFLVNSRIPAVDPELLPRARRELLRREARVAIDALRGQPGYRFLDDPELTEAFAEVGAVLAHLQRVSVDDLPEEHRRTHVFDTWTEAGRHAAFRSRRGTEGRRRFFSPDNGLRLDAMLNQLRQWWREGAVDPVLLDLCCAVICRAAEQVANHQGTWHDFPRRWIDRRALQPVTLTPPPMDAALAGGDHLLGDAEDSLVFVDRCPEMAVLYLDPPYNFRQYTSYYFLPNLLCRYPRMDDPGSWFADVRYVRGQNMADDFDSPFCSKGRFLDALRDLVERARARVIVLSYFNGRNHWNDFKQDPNGVGLAKLTAFFSDEPFERGSLEILPIPRTNYQSYGGHAGRRIDEYLFVARKRGGALAASAGRSGDPRRSPQARR